MVGLRHSRIEVIGQLPKWSSVRPSGTRVPVDALHMPTVRGGCVNRLRTATVLAIALGTPIVAEIGDLVESALKLLL